MPKPTPPKYRTTNWSKYTAALKRRESLEIWFDPDMEWLSAPSGRQGRPMRFSDSAIRVCLTLKTVFGLSLRQVTGWLRACCDGRRWIGRCRTTRRYAGGRRQ